MGKMSQTERIAARVAAVTELREGLADVPIDEPMSAYAGIVLADALLELYGLVGQVGAAAEQLQKHPLLGGLIRQFGLQ